MITDIAVDEVEFRCPQSHWRESAVYDVVSCTDAEGGTWEFYSLDGVPVLPPYTVDGAPLCPECRRTVPGRQVARRIIPVPPGDDDRPRQRSRETPPGGGGPGSGGTGPR